jgi:uncharacterized protein YjiS (DUF1127 family)
MTTTDFADIAYRTGAEAGPIAEPKGRGMVAGIKARYAAWRQRRAGRMALVELSQLDAHLLRDIGVNAADVEAALRHRRRSIWLYPWRDESRHE